MKTRPTDHWLQNPAWINVLPVVLVFLLWCIDSTITAVFHQDISWLQAFLFQGIPAHHLMYRLIGTAIIVGGYLLYIISIRSLQDDKNKAEVLNSILSTNACINRAISHASSTDELYQLAAKELVRNELFTSSWILDDSNPKVRHFRCSNQESFCTLIEHIISAQTVPQCVEKARQTEELVVFEEPELQCESCPVRTLYPNQAGLCKRLSYKGVQFGYLVCAFDRSMALSHAIQSQFEDIAQDISLAAWSIRNRETLEAAQSTIESQDQFLRSTLDSLSAHIALLDENGVILEVNKAWREFAKNNNGQMKLVSTGCNYLDVCDQATGMCSDGSDAVANGIREVIRGKRSEFRMEYPCHSPSEHRWFVCHVTTCDSPHAGRVVVAHENVTLLKETQVNLESTYRRQQTAIRSGRVGLWEWDLTTNLVEFSPEWKAQIGYEDHEISNSFEEWRRRVHPDDLEAVEEILKNFIQSNQVNAETCFRFQHKDGSWRWILAQSSKIRNESGETSIIIGSHIDITDQVRSDVLFNNFFNQSLNLHLICDFDGSIKKTNIGWYHVLGYTEDEIVGHSIREFIHPDDLEPTTQELAKLQSGQRMFYFENRYRHVSGDYRLLAWSAFASLEDGYVYASAKDITSERESVVALKQSEERFRTIVNALPSLVLIANHDLVYEFANDTFCRTYNRSRESIVGSTVREVLGEELFEQAREGIEYVLTGETVRYQKWVLHPEHGRNYVDVTLIPRFDPQSSVTGYYAIIQNLTDLMSVHEELKLRECEYRNLFSSIKQGVVYIDDAGRITSANPSARKILGLSGDELPDIRTCHEGWKTIREDGREFHADEYPSSIARKTMRNTSSTLMGIHNLQTHELHWLDVNAYPQIDQAKESVSIVCLVFEDITEQRAAQMAIQRSEDRYRQMFTQNEAVKLIINPDTGMIVEANPAASRFYGYSNEELVQKTIFELNTLSRQEIQEKMDEARASTIKIMHFEHRLASGETRFVHEYSGPLNVDGKRFLYSIIFDETDRVLAEQKLEDERNFLQTLLETIPNAVFYKNADGIYLGYNKHFLHLFGEPESALVGKTVYDLKRTTDHQTYEEKDRELIEKGGTQVYENTIVDVEGHRKHILVQKALFADKDHNTAGIVGSVTDITELKEARESARRSELRYRQMFESNQAIKLIVDPDDYRIVEANQAACEYYGYSLAELTSRTLIDINCYSRKEIEDEVKASSEAGRAFYEVKHKLADGEIRDVQVYTGRVAIEDKELLHCIVFDITQRRAFEKSLKQSEARFRALAENIPGVIYLCRNDECFRMLYLNAQITELTGYTKEEFLHDSISIMEICHPDDKSLVRTSVEKAVSSKQPYQMKYRIRHKDQSWRWVEEHGIAVQAEDNLLEGILLDISDRVKQDEAQKQLLSAIEQSSETILITDLNGTITYANPAFEDVSGYSREEAIGKSPSILKSNKHPGEFYENMWKTISGGEIWNGEIINKAKDGHLYKERVSISPVRDDTGDIVNYVAVKRDITKEEELQQQYLQSQKMESVGRLAGGVAHDFNNMLSVIIGYSSIVKTKLDEDDPMYPMMDQINSAAERSANLTRQLLAFARKQNTTPKHISLSATIEEMLKMLNRLIGENIELQFTPSKNDDVVYIDPGQVDQILVNLCVNARDSIEGNGVIQIRVATVPLDEKVLPDSKQIHEDHFVLLSVSDTGQGIERESLDKIFEPFFTTKAKGEGTGLGLATVYGIVKQNDGYIRVHSDLNHGTVFYIYLPLHELGNQELEEDTHDVDALRGSETIWLVEDESTLLTLTKDMLSQYGYQVRAYPLPQTLLGEIHNNASKPHLLVTDVIMPTLNGKELAEQVRQVFPDISVLYVSGYTSDVLSRHGIDNDAYHFLQKPFTPVDLARKVREILDSK